MDDCNRRIDKTSTYVTVAHRFTTIKLIKMPRTSWSDRDIDELKNLWILTDPMTQGYAFSAAEIGDRLGFSKNAVIGQANRLGLPPRMPGRTAAMKKEFKRRRLAGLPAPPLSVAVRKPPKPPKPIKPKFKVIPMPEQPKQLALPEALHIPLLKIKDGECRSIIDGATDKHGLAVCCGSPTELGRSYCRYHESLYFEPPKNRGVSHGRGTTASNSVYAIGQVKVTATTQRGAGQRDQSPPPQRRTGTS